MLKLHIPVSKFTSRVLIWYRKNRRKLPWRENSDLYHIWVSEIMLQQTQVRTVIPYYNKFLRRFPRLEDLARANENEVLSVWSGLGYYNRARNLLSAAQIVFRQYGGNFPQDYRQALQLPGIGRYTAGAILSITYGQPLPILDGNIRRLFSRYLNLDITATKETKQLWNFLTDLVIEPCIASQIGDFNQALMELGAIVCTRHNPDCSSCPLSSSCLAHQRGTQETLPVPRKLSAPQEFHYTVALISKNGQYLFRQNHEDKFLQGFWEFPRIQGRPEQSIEKSFLKVHQLELKIQRRLGIVRHQITSRKLFFHPILVTLLSPVPKKSFVWTTPGKRGYPISSYIRKVLQAAEAQIGNSSV